MDISFHVDAYYLFKSKHLLCDFVGIDLIVYDKRYADLQSCFFRGFFSNFEVDCNCSVNRMAIYGRQNEEE